MGERRVKAQPSPASVDEQGIVKAVCVKLKNRC